MSAKPPPTAAPHPPKSDPSELGTGTNARILKLDRMGTVAVKKEADFVVLDANPLDDIANTLRISSVYLKGKEVDRKALRARFAAAGKKSSE